MKYRKPLPSAERLRKLFNYNAETGVLSWKVSPRMGSVKAGDEAGSAASGYRIVKIDGVGIGAHRIIWKIMTGDEPGMALDHADGEKANNKWKNLRAATASENVRNSRPRKPFKGATFNKRLGKWQAQIGFGGKCFYLGLFDSPEEAHSAYCVAAHREFGEFARTS